MDGRHVNGTVVRLLCAAVVASGCGGKASDGPPAADRSTPAATAAAAGPLNEIVMPRGTTVVESPVELEAGEAIVVRIDAEGIDETALEDADLSVGFAADAGTYVDLSDQFDRERATNSDLAAELGPSDDSVRYQYGPEGSQGGGLDFGGGVPGCASIVGLVAGRYFVTVFTETPFDKPVRFTFEYQRIRGIPWFDSQQPFTSAGRPNPADAATMAPLPAGCAYLSDFA